MNAILADKTMPAKDDLAHALRVLNAEAEAIRALAASLDGSFSQAVEAIHSMKQTPGGRLIVAGIGKSGHVARKIAATLASTGTPSYFVHPGEASHGDLGMVTENDIVLLISNSGGSAELSDLIHYTRRFGITLVSITANPEGPLAQHADINLFLPQLPEACPNGLAPTTSTTMTMALGDALAVALLERTGLTADDFKIFHPGGKLGQKLQKISDLMQTYENLPLASTQSLMEEILLTMTAKNMGCVLILEEGTKALAGIITDGDLKRHMAPDLLSRRALEIMSVNPKTIRPDALAVEAMNVMTKTPDRYLTSLVVMDGTNLVGLIRLQDCLQAGVA